MGEALNPHDMAFEDPRTAKRPRTSFLNRSIQTMETSHLRNLSFLSLPGEIRNAIYYLTLVADGPISVCHGHISKGLVFLREDRDGPLSLEGAEKAFLKLASLNTQICWEATSYFYANNTIMLQTRGIIAQRCSATRYEPAENGFWLYGNNPLLRDEVPHIPTQLTLLQGIGACGRKFITSLELDYWTASEAYIVDQRAFFDDFFSLLKTCTNLKALTINFEMAMTFVGEHAIFPGNYSFIGPVLEDFARKFIDIGKLERLVIVTDGIEEYVRHNWPLTWSGDDIYIIGMLDWGFQKVFDDYERNGNKRAIVEVHGC